MDEELFKLCKEVYKKTDWKPAESRWWIINEYGERTLNYSPAVHNPTVPLYTSDYLLEKLHSYKIDLFVMDDNSWCAMPKARLADIRASIILARKSDTPLKALLKLTLALAEAGELK